MNHPPYSVVEEDEDEDRGGDLEDEDGVDREDEDRGGDLEDEDEVDREGHRKTKTELIVKTKTKTELTKTKTELTKMKTSTQKAESGEKRKRSRPNPFMS
ncbi:hypothetical protein ACLB2K_014192 [Fragaria x ananassa]